MEIFTLSLCLLAHRSPALPLPTPYSPFPIHLSFEISSKYLMNILTPPAVWPQS